jgi:hypothetical protein
MGYQMPNGEALKGQSSVTGSPVLTKRDGIIGLKITQSTRQNAHRDTSSSF